MLARGRASHRARHVVDLSSAAAAAHGDEGVGLPGWPLSYPEQFGGDAMIGDRRGNGHAALPATLRCTCECIRLVDIQGSETTVVAL